MNDLDMKQIGDLMSKSADTADIPEVFKEIRHVREHGEHPGYSTGWNKFDEYFKFPPFGQLNVITGAPGSGKTEWLDSLALNMVTEQKWKILIYSPENNPLSYHLKKMTEKATGKPFSGNWNGRENVTMKDIDLVEKVMIKYFTFINSQIKGASVEEIINTIILKSITDKVNMVIIDPWNKVENAISGEYKETVHIGKCLSKLQMIARQYNISIWISAHPAKPTKKQDGTYSPVTLYDISGSAHWFNMTDNAFVAHRSWEDKTGNDNNSDIKIAKIKDRRYGKCGELKFKFEPWCSRLTDCY